MTSAVGSSPNHPIEGTLQLHGDKVYVERKDQSGDWLRAHVVARWEGPSNQPFVACCVSNLDSIELCRTRHDRCKGAEEGNQGCWNDPISQNKPALPTGIPSLLCIVSTMLLKMIAPYTTLSDFPQWLPLRVLRNPDGVYKKDGDLVRLRQNGQWILLSCESRQGAKKSFAEELAYRVKLGTDVQKLFESQEPFPPQADDWVPFT
jgi:hypothetical protein